MPDANSIAIVLTVAAVTLATRAAPFVLFGSRETPRIILDLGRALPPAVMAMLVVYCFKAVDLSAFPFGAPELIAAAVVIGLHLTVRKTLLSIAAGTIVYMLLIQLVF